MLQSKDTEWQTGLKNRSLHYAAYKRPTVGQRTQIESEGIEKDISYK